LNLKQVHEYMLSLPGAWEDRPFGPDVPVFKVGRKMFAYSDPEKSPPRITIKLDPLHGQLLRSTYQFVQAGYHMNKDHWNTVTLDEELPEEELLAWIDESYELVVASLTRAERASLDR
jgi:predicted DNA-binding protein (MmcQ/YjbR family)